MRGNCVVIKYCGKVFEQKVFKILLKRFNGIIIAAIEIFDCVNLLVGGG